MAQIPESAHTVFKGYKNVCGTRVASFRDSAGDFVLNKKNVKTRLDSLKRQKLPCEQTEKAFKGF